MKVLFVRAIIENRVNLQGIAEQMGVGGGCWFNAARTSQGQKRHCEERRKKNFVQAMATNDSKNCQSKV